MSSVTKPVSASTSPVTTSRPGSASRQVSSSYGSVSELFAQTGVRGEDDNRDFDQFGKRGEQDSSREQPRTLKLHGTSRTFAMLFEDAQESYQTANDDGSLGEDGYGAQKSPVFQAYMDKATSTYDLNTRAINGETKVRGNSLNIAM